MSEDSNQNKENGLQESGDAEDLSKPVTKKVAKHDSGAADLEKVTDFEEEREISSQNIAGVCLLISPDHWWLLTWLLFKGYVSLRWQAV